MKTLHSPTKHSRVFTKLFKGAGEMSTNISPPGTPYEVLLLTNKPALAEAITLALNHGACNPHVVASQDEAMAVLKRQRFHIAVLDIDVDGATLSSLSSGKARSSRVPIIVLTSRSDLKTKLEAFDKGADDILTLPFAPEELLARVVAIVRRTYNTTLPLVPVLKIADIEVDIVNRKVHVGSHEPHLTALEMALLYLLAANQGRVLSREDILDSLWGSDYVADSNVVDRHIRNLRVKLESDTRRPKYIFTVHNQGYRFMRPASRQA
jgi:two-component system response regulator RegX3